MADSRPAEVPGSAECPDALGGAEGVGARKSLPKLVWQYLRAWTPRRSLFVKIVGVLVVLDQLSKYAAVSRLTAAFWPYFGEPAPDLGGRLWRFLWMKHPGRTLPVQVIESFWRFDYRENTGVAWGFLGSAADWLRLPFFIIATILALALIVVYFRKTAANQVTLQVALALVFGGALGNFFDRVRLGYVIDFIRWQWPHEAFVWVTFNLADVAIGAGVGLMLLDMLLGMVRAEESAQAGQEADAVGESPDTQLP